MWPVGENWKLRNKRNFLLAFVRTNSIHCATPPGGTALLLLLGVVSTGLARLSDWRGHEMPATDRPTG